MVGYRRSDQPCMAQGNFLASITAEHGYVVWEKIVFPLVEVGFLLVT